MKKKLLIAVSAITVLTASSFVAGDCAVFEPFTKGTQYTITSYDAAGKVNSTMESTVEEVKADGAKTTASISVVSKRDTSTSTSKYDLICDGTSFKMDITALAKQQAAQAGGAKDADISIEADQLEFPVAMKVGDPLPGGTIKMTMKTKQSPMPAVTTITIKDRKCVAVENRTTPAGTYECYKITSTMDGQMKMATMSFPIAPTQSIEWFSFKVGSVRNESYKDGKLQGYTELTKFTKGKQ
jgi:hypothetical protein